MHPILPIYALISLYALFGLRLEQRYAHTNIWIAGWGSMVVVLFAAVFREISGDTFRYFLAFEQKATQSLTELWESTTNNWLFELLNWGLAQFGTHPLWFILPITVICIAMMRSSLRLLLNTTDTAIAMLLYSAYPFFIFYVSSGIRQALAMAMLLQGYVWLYRNNRIRAMFWIILAPLFHSGALLVYPFVLLHYLIWRPGFGYRNALVGSLLLLLACSIMSITGYNQELMAPIRAVAEVEQNYNIYFTDAAEVNYQAGFRLDFTLFSIVPFVAALWLRRKGQGLSAEVSGWWLNLYTLLMCIYQLFAFAPFADRFAAFGWYLVPAIIVLMLRDTGSLSPRRTVILTFAIMNIAILQFYTGLNLHVAF